MENAVFWSHETLKKTPFAKTKDVLPFCLYNFASSVVESQTILQDSLLTLKLQRYLFYYCLVYKCLINFLQRHKEFSSWINASSGGCSLRFSGGFVKTIIILRIWYKAENLFTLLNDCQFSPRSLFRDFVQTPQKDAELLVSLQ
jgi:hypothetical protein